MWYVFVLIQGIGHGMVIMTGIVAIYYNVILSWAIYYFAMSFSAELPWSNCNNDWNTENCYLRIGVNSTTNVNQTTNSSFSSNNTDVAGIDVTFQSMVKNTSARRTPTEEFWE